MNRIMLAAKYSRALNMVYKESAKTAVLDTTGELVRDGVNANEIIVPSLVMDGLADYSRDDGYVKGGVSLTWSTLKFNYERGRMFSVDDMKLSELMAGKTPSASFEGFATADDMVLAVDCSASQDADVKDYAVVQVGTKSVSASLNPETKQTSASRWGNKKTQAQRLRPIHTNTSIMISMLVFWLPRLDSNQRHPD